MKLYNFNLKNSPGRINGKPHGDVEFMLDGVPIKGHCINSDDSFYVKLEDGVGLKMIKDNEKKIKILEKNLLNFQEMSIF